MRAEQAGKLEKPSLCRTDGAWVRLSVCICGWCLPAELLPSEHPLVGVCKVVSMSMYEVRGVVQVSDRLGRAFS